MAEKSSETLTKQEIRKAIKEAAKALLVLPKNKLEKRVEIAYRGLCLSFATIVVYLLKEGVILLLALGLIALWFVYEYVAKGR